MKIKLLLQASIVLLLSVFAAHSALGITVLGNNPFHPDPLNGADEVRSVLLEKKADVNEGLGKAGSGELAEAFFAQLPAAQISQVQYYKGQAFEWMFYRKNGKGKVRIDKGVVWESDEPLKSYEFFIDYQGQRYTFAVPPICTNLALLGVEPVPAAVPPVAPPPQSAGQSESGSPGAGSGPQVAQAPPAEAAEKIGFIADAGYMRLLDPGEFVFVRFGLEFPVNENFSITGMAGGAHKYEGMDGKNAFVADILANYNISRFFIAAGLGAWLTSGDSELDSEDSDLDLIFNLGARVFGEPEAFNTSVFLEVRSAVDELDDFDLYGRVGAGLRFRF